MFSYQFYKVVHLLGIFFVLVSLGGLSLHAINRGSKQSNNARALVAASHGIGLFLVLLGGFGLLARLGVAHGAGWPGWVWVKLGVWVVLGGLIALPYRRPELGRALWFVVPLLGALAAYMAVYHPF